MADKLVSNKTGKLAKQVGFNWKTVCYVDRSVRDGKFGRSYEPDGFTNKCLGKDPKVFSVPTQTTLHKFLMGLGYYVQVTKHFKCFAFQVLKYNEFEDRNDIIIDEHLADYTSHELALEDGLYMTLKYHNNE